MASEDEPPISDAPESADAPEPAPAPESGQAPESADAPKSRVIRRGDRPPAPSGPAPASAPSAGTPAAGPAPATPRAMIPARESRPPVEAVLMRIIATAGIIGICVAIAAIMGSAHSKAWVIGLVTSIVSVLLAAVLWSSRRV